MPLPPRVPVRTPAHTGRGTEWKPAEDCGTAPPGLVTPVWRNQTVSSYSQTHVNKSHVMCKTTNSAAWRVWILWLHLSSGISPRPPEGETAARPWFLAESFPHLSQTPQNPVFPIAVHQVPETLFGCRDGVRPRTSTPSMSNRSPNKLRSCSHTSSKQNELKFLLVS